MYVPLQRVLIEACMQRVIRKVCDGEVLIRTLPTIFHHIFCKIILNFEVIVKSFIIPDDNFQRNSLAIMG